MSTYAPCTQWYRTAPQYLTDTVQSVTSASSRSGLRRPTLPNMSNAVQGLSLGSGGSASLAQLLGIGYHLTCSAVQTLMVLRKNTRLFCFNLLLINFSLCTFSVLTSF